MTFTAKPSKNQKLEPTYKSPLKLTQILATTKITWKLYKIHLTQYPKNEKKMLTQDWKEILMLSCSCTNAEKCLWEILAIENITLANEITIPQKY